MAQRDNFFDPAMLDIALRDTDILKAHGKQRAEAHEQIGIGACADGACGVTYPTNFDQDYLGCYFQVLPQAALNVPAGTAFSLVFNSVDPFFLPCAVSATVRDFVDKGLTRAANFGSVTIDGCRYEGINTNPLTAASTQFWTSRKWDPLARNGCACPVCWGPFTNVAGGYPLTINGFNPNAVPIDVIVEVYGESRRCLPEWCSESDVGTWKRPRMVPAVIGAGVGTTAGRRGAYA